MKKFLLISSVFPMMISNVFSADYGTYFTTKGLALERDIDNLTTYIRNNIVEYTSSSTGEKKTINEMVSKIYDKIVSSGGSSESSGSSGSSENSGNISLSKDELQNIISESIKNTMQEFKLSELSNISSALNSIYEKLGVSDKGNLNIDIVNNKLNTFYEKASEIKNVFGSDFLNKNMIAYYSKKDSEEYVSRIKDESTKNDAINKWNSFFESYIQNDKSTITDKQDIKSIIDYLIGVRNSVFQRIKEIKRASIEDLHWTENNDSSTSSSCTCTRRMLFGISMTGDDNTRFYYMLDSQEKRNTEFFIPLAKYFDGMMKSYFDVLKSLPYDPYISQRLTIDSMETRGSWFLGNDRDFELFEESSKSK